MSLARAGLFFLAWGVGLVSLSAQLPPPPATNATARAAKPQVVVVPLVIENQVKGEVPVRIPADRSELRIEAAPLLQELESWVKPAVFTSLKQGVDTEGNLTLPGLTAAGFTAVFDETALELHIGVPPGLRPPSDIAIQGRRLPADAAQALKPSFYSAYVNLRGGADYIEQSVSGFDEGLQPLRLDLEGALRVGDWVLESDAMYYEKSRTPWQRGNSRLVRDDPENRMRYSLGDLSYPVTGAQSFQPLLGFSAAKNFSLQPYRVTEPRGQSSFFIKSPSKVEVLVNGRPVQTLQLAAGAHNLRDFQFANGANEVVLKITDDVGHQEILNLSFFFDSQLLARGEQAFAYNIGLPSRVNDGRRDYIAEFPTVSAFHRLGLSDTLTAGLNYQGDRRVQLLGSEAVWATPAGVFQPELALSRLEGAGFDYSPRLQYSFQDASPRNAWGNLWTLAAQYRGRYFGSLGTLTPYNRTALELSIRYSRRFPWQWVGGLGGTYQLNRDGLRDTHGVNLFVSKRWNLGLSSDINLDYRRRETGAAEYRAYVSLTWYFAQSRHMFHSSYDSLSDISRVDWQYNSPDMVGGVNAIAGVQQGPDSTRGFGSAHYASYRTDSMLSHEVTTPSSPGGQIDNRTSLRTGTALVFADGHLALSRPVNDSFALVVPDPSWKHQKIGLDPVNDRYLGRADRFGPGVLPDLQSYQVRRLVLDAPDLPVGYELGPDLHTLWPTYKSGTVIRVGTGATVIIKGILETAEGAPIGLQAGKVTALDDPKWPAVTLFTNRKGRFQCEGFKPGRYALEMLADAKAKIAFEIPKDKAGLWDLGSLRFPAGVKFE